ncbi:MAG: hypothetical protein ABIA77_00200 [Candidatus Omnitrophota bacterium]
MRHLILILAAAAVIFTGSRAYCLTEILFDFEQDEEGWNIPDWAFEQGNYVGRTLEVSGDKTWKSKQALKLGCDFPGDIWTAALVEFERDMDLSGYKSITAHVFLPGSAQGGLYQARIIVTAGPWWFIEMKEAVQLKPGKWVTIKADLNVDKQSEGIYWKIKNKDASLIDNIRNVRKIAVRIEHNVNPWKAGTAYKGPVYIDQIVIE